MSTWRWTHPPEPHEDWCDENHDGDCHPLACRCADCDPDYHRDLRDGR